VSVWMAADKKSNTGLQVQEGNAEEAPAGHQQCRRMNGTVQACDGYSLFADRDRWVQTSSCLLSSHPVKCPCFSRLVQGHQTGWDDSTHELVWDCSSGQHG
jgi:hypothetical protein